MNEDLISLWEAVSKRVNIGTFERFSGKMQTIEERKSFYDTVTARGVNIGGYEEYENRLSASIVPAQEAGKVSFFDTDIDYNLETITSTSAIADPIEVAGYDFENHKSLFNKSEGSAVQELSTLFPDFNFKQATNFKDVLEISTKDGKHSAKFDVNVDAFFSDYRKAVKYKRKIDSKEFVDRHGTTTTHDMEYFTPRTIDGKVVYQSNLYGKKYTLEEVKKLHGAIPMTKAPTQKQGKEESYNILKDFVNKYSTEKGKAEQLDAKNKRRKLLENINVKRDEIAGDDIAITNLQFSSGELFKKYSRTKVVHVPGSANVNFPAGTTKTVEYEVQPYEEELKRALKDLKAEYKADGKKDIPTTEEVHARAKEYVIDGIQEKALEQVISSDEYQGKVISLYPTLGSKIGEKVTHYVLGATTQMPTTVAQKYTLAAKEFDLDFKKDLELFEAKSLELTEGNEITRYNEIHNQLKDNTFKFEVKAGENVLTLKDGRQVPESIFNEFKELDVKITNKFSALKKFQEGIMKKSLSYGDNVAALDIARRNYDGLEKFLVTLGLGTVEMYFNATIGMSLAGGGYNQHSIDFLADLKSETAKIRDGYKKDIAFENAFDSLSNFGTFMAQEVANQIPVFATLAIPGGVGVAALGFSAFGEHYVNLAVERESKGGRQLSNAKMWWMSAGYGASEVVFESLTTLPLIRAAKRGFRTTPGTKTLQDQTFGKYFKDNVGRFGYGALSEPIGEGMTQISQNMIDGRPITENLGHAMFSGLMFGTTLSAAPFMKGLYLSQFNDHASNIEYRERIDKIKNLNLTNLNIKINLKGGITNTGTQNDIDNNNKIIADLQAENETHVREKETLVNGLSGDATRQYFALTAEQESLKNEAIEVDNNTTLTTQQKNDRLRTLQVKFDNKQRQRDFFRDPKAFGREYDAYAGLDENAEDVAELRANAEEELKIETTKARREKGKEPTDIEIDNRARFNFNVRKIKRDHAANSKAGLTDTKLFQTNEEVIEWIESLENVSEGTKARFFKDMKGSNTHGGNVPTIDKQNLAFIVVDNMAADDRLETRTHEVGHSVFIKAISADPAAFKGLSDQITEYLKQANPAAYKRLIFRLSQAGAIKEKLYDETIMVFLEEVASGKVDIAKSKQAGFFATLMNKGIEDVGGRKIDLKGETDAINFLIGIAKKIKAGTIDVSDIKAIRESKIAKKARASVTKTKAKPKAKFSKRDFTPKQVTDIINKLGRVDKDGNNLQEKGVGNFYYKAEVDDIIKEIKEKGYLDNLIAAQYKGDVVPASFVNDVITQLIPDIRGFEPEQNNSLFAYLNSRIKFRAGDVYKKLYKGDEAITKAKDIGETTKEGEVKVQVAAEKSAEMEAFEEEDISPAARAKKKAEKDKVKEKRESKFRKQLGIETGGDLYNQVLDSARKALLRAYETGTSVRNIQRKLRDEANVYLFKILKNFLGTKKYISNLKEFRIPIMEAIFTADLVQMERNVPENERVFTKFVRKLTSKEEVQAAVDQNLLPASALNIIDKGTAVSLYKKVMPSESKFLSFFDIPTINPKTGLRSGKRGTRKDALAKAMAGALSYDATMEVAQEPETIKKREELAELKGEVLPQDNLERLAEEIGRDPKVKFSSRVSPHKAALYLQAKESSLYEGHPAKPFFELMRVLVEEGHQIESVVDIVKEQFGVGTSSLYSYSHVLNLVLSDTENGLSRSHIENVVWAINNFLTPKRRKLGHDASIEYLKNELSKAKNIDQKIKIVNEYLINIGRPLRTFAAVDKITNITTNRLLLEEVIQKLGDPKLAARYQLKPVLGGEGVYYIDRNGKSQPVEIYERVKNIKNNAYNDKALVQKINDQAEKAQAYIFKVLDSNLTNSEKKAIVELMAVDMRGALRKVSKLGMVVDRSNKFGKKYDSKNTTLEHELTIRDLQDKVNDYIDGSKEGLQKIFNESRVHVIPNTLNDILTAEGLKHKGGFDRYNNAEFKKELDKLIEKGVIINAKFSKAQDFQKINKAVKFSRSTNNPAQGITVLDFDDTLATTESLVRFTRPNGTTGTLNAEQYAGSYESLLKQGYTFDFSEFNKVVKPKLAPLFNKAMKLQSKFGPENMFVLTARPAAAVNAIHAFLKANGLNIPLKNITGLNNSTAEAKALWISEKVGEGYNDFYFADDALQNVKAVKNMLDQFDVKSKVQQARVKFSSGMNEKFNDILENVTGIDSKKRFSAIKARKRGEKKGRFRFFIPPSHEDFVGLLYNFIGKGKEGNKHRDFFEEALIKPLNRADRELNTAKQSIANDYKSLNKKFPDTKGILNEKIDGDFTVQDAIRVYLWDKHGHEIPGLSKADKAKLVEFVVSDLELQTYAETLNIISKQEKYVAPTESWEGGDIRTDLDDATGRIGRGEFFTEFFENADVIFSQENLNKIEAAYGADVVSAIKDMLYRIKTGRNRPSGQNKLVNQFLNYLNGSVGATMFFNIRSSVLQQMSMVNFINFADNNVFAAAKAFANQKQYWADWAYIFNSDFMKQRRAGIGTDVNGAELAASVKGARNPIQAAIKKLLELGFLPTQIGDNIAIATGGATFYRNRVHTYIKQGMGLKQAESEAWIDFQKLAEATQQSAKPWMVSQQQASPLGKVILAFQNVTSQFNRLGKKAFLDIKNRRITPGNTTQLQSDISNLSRISYYFAIQNLIFYSLQSALFMMMFNDDEDDEKFLNKKERIVNGSIDSVLRGTGVWGSVVATLKNMAIKNYEQREKDYNPDESAVLMEMLNVSPPLGIKARKMVNAEKTLNYNKKVIDEMETFDIDNPMWSAYTSRIEAITNIPLNRLYNKTQNVRQSLNNQHSAFERALLFSGWSQWNLGIENKEIKEIKEQIKKEKKKKKKPLTDQEVRKKNYEKSKSIRQRNFEKQRR